MEAVESGHDLLVFIIIACLRLSTPVKTTLNLCAAEKGGHDVGLVHVHSLDSENVGLIQYCCH